MQVGSEIKLTIAGNKLDLERQRVVSRQEASEYAESVGAHYCETSAKQNRGIDELFSSMGKRLLQAQAAKPAAGVRSGRSSRGSSMVLIEDEPSSSGGKSSGCC